MFSVRPASRACAHCTTPLTNHHLTSLILHCPTTSSTTSSACPARFCNRLCLKRSEKTHPLLCPAQNPASVPLLTFARKHVWMALRTVAQCSARLLLAHQQKQGRQHATQRAGISSRDSEEGGYARGLECVLRACGPRNGGAGKGRLVRLRLHLHLCLRLSASASVSASVSCTPSGIDSVVLCSCVSVTPTLKVARCGA